MNIVHSRICDIWIFLLLPIHGPHEIMSDKQQLMNGEGSKFGLNDKMHVENSGFPLKLPKVVKLVSFEAPMSKGLKLWYFEELLMQYA